MFFILAWGAWRQSRRSPHKRHGPTLFRVVPCRCARARSRARFSGVCAVPPTACVFSSAQAHHAFLLCLHRSWPVAVVPVAGWTARLFFGLRAGVLLFARASDRCAILCLSSAPEPSPAVRAIEGCSARHFDGSGVAPGGGGSTTAPGKVAPPQGARQVAPLRRQPASSTHPPITRPSPPDTPPHPPLHRQTNTL